MTPIATLKHEHQVILMVLDAAQREARTIEATGKVSVDRIDKLVEFFRNFADRCHHAKEEKQLFIRMADRGMAVEGGPIAVMLAEHEEGRRHIAAIAQSLPRASGGEASAIASVREHLEAYLELLRQHIDKEDNVLYVMADQVLTAEDQQELAEAFERVEAKEMGEGIHEKYHQLAHEPGGGLGGDIT